MYDSLTVNVVPAGDVADEVVWRLASCELPAYAADIIREAARSGTYYNRSTIYLGNQILLIESRAKPDGSLELQLDNQDGSMIWSTTLRPPAEAPAKPAVRTLRYIPVDDEDDEDDEF